ncbi:Vacuolar protein sorting-associated protein 53, partial [Dimargaris xerosporica]
DQTKLAIQALYDRISEMKQRAELSEGTVLNITQDIKALDNAKRNLVAAVTLLKRLQMLTIATEQLQSICESRRYKEASHLLLAVQELQGFFEEYHQLPDVIQLSSKIEVLKKTLAHRIREDFEQSFNDQGVCVGSKARLKDACDIMDLLQGPERDRMVSAYCNMQLAPYIAIFKHNDEVSSLDNVSRRYAWLRRVLRTHDEEHASIFPASWAVEKHMCLRFAEITRKQISTLLAESGSDVDVAELLRALQLTMSFERQLDRRFGRDQTSTAAQSATEPSSPGPLHKCISQCFEPYLSLYIAAEERTIQGMLDKFKSSALHTDEDPSMTVLSSSTDLLYFYREALGKCAALSTGQPLFDLVQAFARGLAAYGNDVLLGKLPKLYTVGENRPMSHDELTRICLIINTADYCHSATEQLEQKVQEKIDPELQGQINFDAQRDTLFNTIHTSIKSLIRGVENGCKTAFSTMVKITWATVESVGDQSEYVTMIATSLRLSVGVIRRSLTNTRYIRTFCDKFVETFAVKYLGTLQRCRQISEIGAEQLLLDIQAIKTLLLELPTLDTDKPEPPSSRYAKLVTRCLSRTEAILKSILAPHDPPNALVDNFLFLFPDAAAADFQTVLDLKGLRKSEQNSLVDLFRQKASVSGGGPSLSLSAVPPSSQPSQAAGSALAPGQFAQTPDPSDKYRSTSNDGLTKPSKSHINHNLRKFMSGMGNVRKGSNEGKSF